MMLRAAKAPVIANVPVTMSHQARTIRYLGRKLAEPHHEDVPNLDRVERLPNASHGSTTTRPSA
jgi:hypothetical protein